jgi:hypothetical protein
MAIRCLKLEILFADVTKSIDLHWLDKALIKLIEPHYPKTSKKGGRPPYPLSTMLRIHLLQQWYSLSDPAMEEALIEVPTMCRFVGIELISDRIPDETTISDRFSSASSLYALIGRICQPNEVALYEWPRFL